MPACVEAIVMDDELSSRNDTSMNVPSEITACDVPDSAMLDTPNILPKYVDTLT